MGQVRGKTTQQGVKGKTKGLSAAKTGVSAGHLSFGGSGKTTGGGLAGLTGRGLKRRSEKQ